MAIILKTLENKKRSGSRLLFYNPNLYKFLLKVFKRLLHSYKVSKLFIGGFLLSLLDYYRFNFFDKLINIFVLKAKFPLLIFGQNFNTTNNVIYIKNSKVKSYFIFEQYFYQNLCFLQMFLYEYYKVVSVVKRKQKQEKK